MIDRDRSSEWSERGIHVMLSESGAWLKQAIANLAKEERRSLSLMSEILLEEALAARDSEE